MENIAKNINEQKHLNGVNVTQLVETVQAIKEAPELAEFKFRAKNTWVDGGHNRIEIKDYYGTCQELTTRDKPFVLDADEPPVLLGNDIGANPVEYLLTALSSCMTTSIALHAAAEGIEIDSINSNYEGDIDLKGFLGISPDVRKGYKEIRVNFKVKSTADKEKLKELLSRSPVFDIVTNPTPVKVKVELE
jgi:uncharacterized OsmC-like protein